MWLYWPLSSAESVSTLLMEQYYNNGYRYSLPGGVYGRSIGRAPRFLTLVVPATLAEDLGSEVRLSPCNALSHPDGQLS